MSQMRLARFTLVAIVGLAFSCPLVFSQQPDSPSPASSQAVIRSDTRLVQVSVIVHDKKGQAIKNLQVSNFSIEDEGKSQRVAFFAADAPAPSQSHPALPPDVFTNRFDLRGHDPGSLTVVLFDTLNTSFEDQSYVRSQVLKFLGALRPQDHVAVYALTRNLLILQDFTSDSSLLVKAVNQFAPREQVDYDASNPQELHSAALAGEPGWQRFEAAVNNAMGEISDQAIANRFSITAAAIESIADHVAGIPGRKNLIWVSGGLPNLLGRNRIGVPGRDVISFEGSGHDTAPEAGSSSNKSKKKDPLSYGLLGVAQSLNRVNMSIYPVDAHGVETDPKRFFARQQRRETFQDIADRTGGKPYFGRNDIAEALRNASDDARFVYTLGYYPDHGKWDGRFRKIKVHVDLPGAQIRSRMGYFAVADAPDDDDRTDYLVEQAAMSPLEATSVGLVVTGKPQTIGSERKLLVQVSLDPKQLLLQQDGDRRQGALDLFFLQTDLGGRSIAAERQRIGLNFTDNEYERFSKTGIILQRALPLKLDCQKIRVVVRDASSSALGSVTIPVNAFFAAQAMLPGTPAPSKP
jgi:VWFA-related protein